MVGTGHSPPTFIRRRLEALSAAGVQCIAAWSGAPENELIYNAVLIREYRIKKNKAELIPVLSRFALSPSRMKRAWNIFRSMTNLAWRSRIIRAIRFADYTRLKVDVLHVHWITHLAELQWLIQALQAPVIASVRGSMVTVYPHKNPGYAKKLEESFRMADRLHFVSKGLMNFCVEQFGVDKTKCFVNYNGIDVERFRPAADRRAETGIIHLVSVGALIWRKNFQDMLKVIQQSQYREQVELHIIGEGEERFIMEFMIQKYGLKGKVHLHGKLPEAEVIRRLQAADIYLSTSYAEGLSNAVVEAAACGLPVIAFNCEGMDEIIIEGKTGVIIPHGRVDLMAQSLDQLIEDKNKRKAMGMAARNHVETNFREDTWVDAMIMEYQNLVQTKKNEISKNSDRRI